MVLEKPSNGTIATIRDQYGLSDQRIKADVQTLKEWLKLQPHLPHEADDERLEQVLLRCKTSLERAKKSLDMYYSLRSAIPEILCNRDPAAPWFKQAAEAAYSIPLPKLSEDYNRVTIISCRTKDPEKFDVNNVLKMIFMVEEVRLSEDYFMSDVIIIDLSETVLSVAIKFTFPVLKKIYLCAEKGYCTRIQAMHIINAPPFTEAIINLAKSFLKPKIANKVHFHSDGIETLYDSIDRNIFPNEYGGNAGPVLDLWTAWQKKLLSYRGWFLDQENLKSNEKNRPSMEINNSDLFGFEGSFRKLTVD